MLLKNFTWGCQSFKDFRKKISCFNMLGRHREIPSVAMRYQNHLADKWQSKNSRQPHSKYQPSKHQYIDPSSKNDAN